MNMTLIRMHVTEHRLAEEVYHRVGRLYHVGICAMTVIKRHPFKASIEWLRLTSPAIKQGKNPPFLS